MGKWVSYMYAACLGDFVQGHSMFVCMRVASGIKVWWVRYII